MVGLDGIQTAVVVGVVATPVLEAPLGGPAHG